ncbi:unnamed protein product [Phytophthora lilii]|uniref:Unnamed protein product n=1 Tax=Phytophthora lilii TaxID=2077276 RepID=A0A9W7CGI5_9STRA|nr:unnamed protein product [Phytophthora lilii]
MILKRRIGLQRTRPKDTISLEREAGQDAAGASIHMGGRRFQPRAGASSSRDITEKYGHLRLERALPSPIYLRSLVVHSCLVGISERPGGEGQRRAVRAALGLAGCRGRHDSSGEELAGVEYASDIN